MININVQVHDGMIVGMNIYGHAYTGEPGKDLVCAGVSSIAFGLCNALDYMETDCTCNISNNIITIKVNRATDKTQTILKTAFIQFETIRESYSKVIKFTNKEV